jgi:ribose transport system substrate-binding protein
MKLNKHPACIFFSLVTLVASLALLSACRRTEPPAPSNRVGPTPVKSRGTIGLSVLTLTNPFFKEIADTMKIEAAKYGYDVLVVSGEFDVARQQNQVKDFIVRKVAAIVLTPC